MNRGETKIFSRMLGERTSRPWVVLAFAAALAFASPDTAIAQATAGAAPKTAAEDVPGYPGVPLFQMPQAAQAEARAAVLLRLGQYDRAADQLAHLTRAFPKAASWRALSAAASAGLGKDAEAIAALEQAVAMGFTDIFGLLVKPPMNRLAGDPRIVALAEKTQATAAAPRLPVARRVANGVAQVTVENSSWDAETGRINVFFAFPKAMRRLPMYGRPQESAALQRLIALVRQGKAAGNVGDLYDNRDRMHSWLRRYEDAPAQLSHVVYPPEVSKYGHDYGVNETLLFNGPTFGNSSTVQTGAFWRSQARHALTAAGGPVRQWRLYSNNHIYVFPEHHDFDSQAEGWHGDLFPAYTPYMIVSQGSSGSDRPYLHAIQSILAAFRPETKTFLIQERLIAPTVQQILRSNLKSAPGASNYMTALAHPTVFNGADVDLAAVIKAAQEMKPEDVPPLAMLGMFEEQRLSSGASFFGDGLSESLFDTPAAIARIWRGVEGRRRYVLKATARDANGHALKYHWRLLRGARDRVRIRTFSEGQASAEIFVDWQDRRPPPERGDITSPRIDIAVFADNGRNISAPAIFSILLPVHQTRVYEDGPRGPRIKSIDYARGPVKYADPRLWPKRDWLDVYSYDRSGAMTGWVRKRRGGHQTAFQADGRRADGVRVHYPMRQEGGKPERVVQETVVK